MAEKKYGKYVNKLKFQKGRGGANARELVFVGGEELGGFELNFIVGVYDTIGDWAPNMGAHIHSFDECLLFFGYDEKDMNYLGSDMALSVGKEYETHKFSVPTVVAAPANVPHCPLVTEKVYKDFGHFHLALAAKYAGTRAEQEGTTNGKKYDYLFKQMKAKKGPGGANAVQSVAVAGVDISGIPMNFIMGLYNKTGEWYPGKGSCLHSYDSVLVFFGNKAGDLSYLGAEITIELGKEHEKHTFDVPTVVSLPKGTPHFPIVCNKIEKPYRVMQVGLSAKYDCSWI
ncbi:MAG: hypothetical protein A2Y90_04865 [Chloroflexi bacterium RBG_13_52_12]|nr:MAG: hypothetical protein A2Y90_04865 [Chloroflexi bacterium RBG_13_52_12]